MNIIRLFSPTILALSLAGFVSSCAPEYSEPVIVAPATLTATPGDASVALEWTAVDEATSYALFWNTIGGVTQNDQSVAVKGTRYTMRKLTNGDSYSFAVASVTAGGVVGSALSKEVAAVPAPSIPLPPTLLSANAGLGSVSLTWTASSGATDYTIFFAGTPGITDKSAPVKVGNVTTYLHQNLPFSVTYYYRVQASNLGGASAMSNELFATLPDDPNAPVTP